jgi:hypothetical protein
MQTNLNNMSKALEYLSKIASRKVAIPAVASSGDDDAAKRDAVLGATGLATGAGGLMLADRWKPNNVIVVGGGHIKDHGVSADHPLRKNKILKKWLWGKTPLNRLHIADTGSGHITPAEAIVQALESHPDVGYTKDKQWILDTALRGGKFGDHNNPYVTQGKRDRAFGTIDTGFGPLSSGLPPGMKLNSPEFSVNPFGKMFVETDPIPSHGIPHISAIHGLSGAETFRDTDISTFGGERKKSHSKVNPAIDAYNTEKPGFLYSNFKKLVNKLSGKYNPVIHASDTVSPYISNATYATNQALIDAVKNKSFNQHDVLKQLAASHPEYAPVIEDAIAKNKRIALITGSSRGDVVAQKTNELLDHLKKNKVNDVQVISVLGERLTPTIQKLRNDASVPPELRNVIDQQLKTNPNLTLEQLQHSLPKGGTHYKAIKRLRDIPRTDKLITDPNVIKLPGVYSELGLDAMGKLVQSSSPAAKQKIKTFLAMQAMFPHWASTGMNSANEAMMLPGTAVFPGDIGAMKEREIVNAFKAGLINKDQMEELRNIRIEKWNEGTLKLVKNKLSKTSPGIAYSEGPEDFMKHLDKHYSDPMHHTNSVVRAQNMLNESKSARTRWAKEYIDWLNKRKATAAKWSDRAKGVGLLGLGAGGVLGLKALLEGRRRRHTDESANLHKQSMEKEAKPRWAKYLAALEKEKTPASIAALAEAKKRLSAALPRDKDAINPVTHRGIKDILKRVKDPQVGQEIARNQQTEYALIRRAIADEKAKGLSTSEAIKAIQENPEKASWRTASRVTEKQPGPKENFSRRGFEGDALFGFNPEHGDVVVKKTHMHPDTTKYRGKNAINVKPSLDPKLVSGNPGELHPHALSSGAPIQEKINLMRAYPDIMAGVISPTNTGYVMPKLTPVDDLKNSKELVPHVNDFVDRLWKDLHPYDKMFRSKKEIKHQIAEGNPKEKWNGLYRKMFGNRTPLTLSNGTAIEDYHLGNLLLDRNNKLVIADPQLSHRGSLMNRHMALAGLGAGAVGLGTGAAHMLSKDKDEKFSPDKTDMLLGGGALAGTAGALASKHYEWMKNRLTPLRTKWMAPSVALGGLSLGALGLKNLLEQRKKNSNTAPQGA